MTNTKHTPSAWVIDKFTDNAGYQHKAIYPSDSNKAICLFGYNGDELRNVEANARLIAAAPELLEALENLLASAECQMVDEDGDTSTHDKKLIKSAYAAIAKARGE